MAYEGPANFSIGTLKAGADLSAAQYKFVKLNSSGQVILCAAVTDVPIGVLQNKPLSGQAAQVLVTGVTKIVAGGALSTLPALIGTDATGRAAAKDVGTDTTNYVVGQLLATAGAAGVVTTAVIDCAVPHRAS